MPELIEAEAYAGAARRAIGATIERASLHDPAWVRGGLSPSNLDDALTGRTIDSVERIGKVVRLNSDGASVALRFGMTGRLLWDDAGPIDTLTYGPNRSEEAWVRFSLLLRSEDGAAHRLAVEDARRLGSVELDADLAALGPDAADLTVEELGAALAGSTTPLKAALLDQRRVAGLGNLLCDEILWRAGLHPATPAGSLDHGRLVTLRDAIAQTLEELGRRGGSHLGDLQPHRVPGGACPLDGTPLKRTRVGGRTSWWCPSHQVER